MKTRIVLLAMLILVIGTMSVEVSAQSKERARELKREAKKAKLQEDYIKTGYLLDSLRFVLEANYLSDARGNRMIVPNALNFIKIDSTKAIIQVGSNTGMGYNGVGGVTAEGRISKWNLKRDEKRKSFLIIMTVMTNIGTYDIFMSITAGGGASATLTGMTYGRLVYDGYIVPFKKSRIFKGSNSY